MAKKSIVRSLFPEEKGFSNLTKDSCVYKGIPLSFSRYESGRNWFQVSACIYNMDLPYAEYNIGKNSLMVSCGWKGDGNGYIFNGYVFCESQAEEASNRIVSVLSPLAERWKEYTNESGKYEKTWWDHEIEQKDLYYKMSKADINSMIQKKKEELEGKYPGICFSFYTRDAEIDREGKLLKERKMDSMYVFVRSVRLNDSRRWISEDDAESLPEIKAALEDNLKNIEGYKKTLELLPEAKKEATEVYEVLSALMSEHSDDFYDR